MKDLNFYYKILKCYFEIPEIKKNTNNNTNILILLAAGTSTRFGQECSKQLYIYNEKELIRYSIETFMEYMDKIIIVTNSLCYDNMVNIANNISNKISVVVNDINCRLTSIECGLNYIKNGNIEPDNIIIHDSARPFISKEYVEQITRNTRFYSQYCLKLTNGLMTKTCDVVDRDNYMELCTPISIKYRLCLLIFDNFMSKNKYTYEFIDILKVYNIPMDFYYGKYHLLKKITYIEDVIY
jgi:2-C-methyl-D-erythritol 4-phosphate cytidylyltransferase